MIPQADVHDPAAEDSYDSPDKIIPIISSCLISCQAILKN